MSKPTKYRSVTWFNRKKREVVYGIDAKINGKWYHVVEGRNKLFYFDRKDAIKKVRILNKELKEVSNG